MNVGVLCLAARGSSKSMHSQSRIDFHKKSRLLVHDPRSLACFPTVCAKVDEKEFRISEKIYMEIRLNFAYMTGIQL
jgi:hypothetical protein